MKATDFALNRTPSALIRALGRVKREDETTLVTAVIPLLHHLEPDVRVEAFNVAFVRWRRKEHRQIAQTALKEDPDERVRSAAALGIAGTSSNDTHRSDIQLLLLVLQVDGANEVKRAAYEGLLLLLGRPDFPDSLVEFDPGKHVDWEWVAELRSIYG
jgi:HEAT repeat protein